MRRFGHAPRTGQVYTRRPGVYAVLLRGRSVLLTHQMAPEPEFQLPGGGIDPGEGPAAALHREVREETGWRIGRLRRLGVYRRFTHMPEYELWADKICAVYLARPARAPGPPEDAAHTAVWVPLTDAADLVASTGDAAYLSRVATGLA